MAVGVEHQGFVAAGFGGLDAGEDAIQLGVAVDARVLGVGVAPAHVDRVQAQAPLEQFRVWGLVFGDDDDGGAADGHRRVLVGRGLDAPGEHQADVRAGFHAVGVDGLVQPSPKRRGGDRRVEIERFGAFPQALEVAAEKWDDAPVQPQPFPDAVAEDEAAVENRHHGFFARKQFAIDIDQNALIARIRPRVVGAGGHRIALSPPGSCRPRSIPRSATSAPFSILCPRAYTA